jgi:hypothetical protein
MPFDPYGSKPWHPAPSRSTMDLLVGKANDPTAIAAFKDAYRAELAEAGLDPNEGVPYTPYAASVEESRHRGQGKDYAFKDAD